MSTFFSRTFLASGVPSGEQRLPRLFRALGIAIDLCLVLLLGLMPLFFLPGTTDVLELSKQSLLFVLTAVAGGAWAIRLILARRVRMVWNWLHVGVIGFVIIYALSALFSVDRWVSFFGSIGHANQAFFTILSLVLWYFITISRVKGVTQLYNLVFVFLFSSLLTSIYGIFQIFGIHLFPSLVTQTPGFTSIGSIYSLASFLVVPLVISAAISLHGCQDKVCLLGQESHLGRASRFLVWSALVVSFVFLLLVDYWPAWLAVVTGLGLTLGLGYLRSNRFGRPLHLLVAGLMMAVSLVLMFLRSPIPVQLPTEVVPSFRATFQIAQEALQHDPVLGMGPGTWAYGYARYRAPMVNQSPFWNIRFNGGISVFLTSLASLGIAGALVWLVLILAHGYAVARHLVREKNDDIWYGTAMLFAGFVSISVIFFTAQFAFAHQVIFWLLLGLLATTFAGREFIWYASTGWRERLIQIKGAFLVGFSIILLWMTGQRLVADRFFSQAIRMYQADSSSLETAIMKAEMGLQLVSWNDYYLRNLSGLYLLRVSEALKKQPTQDEFVSRISPQVVSLVNFAKRAVEQSPANIDNWMQLGYVYQSIAGFTDGADEFALKSFEEVLMREPTNVVALSEMGSMYLLRADSQKTLLASKDAVVRKEAEGIVSKSLQEAEKYLRKAIELKPDYLPARYRLGVVYEREGKVASAIVELESVLRTNRQDAGIAFELALLYYRNGEFDRAVALMEQVALVQPNDANVNWYLAAMYEDRGRLDDAVARMRTLANLLPDNEAIKQRLQILEQARGAKPGSNTKTLPEPIGEKIKTLGQ